MVTLDLGLFNPADCSQVRQFAGGHGVGGQSSGLTNLTQFFMGVQVHGKQQQKILNHQQSSDNGRRIFLVNHYSE